MTPMEVYKEVSNWKGKCTELLDTLRNIAKLPESNVAQRAAANAIRRFEETK